MSTMYRPDELSTSQSSDPSSDKIRENGSSEATSEPAGEAQFSVALPSDSDAAAIAMDVDEDIGPGYLEADNCEMDVIEPANASRVLSWGRSDFGCLLSLSDEDCRESVRCFSNPIRTIISASSNVYHTAAVTSTGELYTCGSNDQGQVSDQPVESYSRPHVAESFANHKIIGASCGLQHTVCVTAAGHALSFGGNESGQLGHSAGKHTKVPPRVVNFNIAPSKKAAMVISKVACGDLFTLFLLTSGEVFGCGSAAFLGNPLRPQQQNIFQAERIEKLVGSNIVQIAAGSSHSLALSSTGQMYGWGDNTHYTLGVQTATEGEGNMRHEQLPILLPIANDVGHITGISVGSRHSVCWTNHGVLLGCGSNKYGQLASLSPRLEAFEPIVLPRFCVMAACGFNHTLALCFSETEPKAKLEPTTPSSRPFLSSLETAEGSTFLYGFGSNNFGQVNPSSAATLERSPQDITHLCAQWDVPRLLYLAAGGDQSFVIGIPRPQEGGVLRKQFSTLVSKAVVAMSTRALQAEIDRALADPSNQKLQSSVLDTVCEVFSSASLLAGSFSSIPSSSSSSSSSAGTASAAEAKHSGGAAPVRYDVEGLEQCYGGILRLGVNAVSRLLASIQQTVTDLERSVASSTEDTPTTPASNASNRSNEVIVTEDNSISLSAVRVICMLWQSPLMTNPTVSSALLMRLLKLALKAMGTMKETIVALFPAHLFASRLLKPLQEHMDFHFLALKQIQNMTTMTHVVVMCEAFKLLYLVNQSTKFVPPEAFHNKEISTLSDQTLVKDYLQWRAVNFPSTGSSTSSTTGSQGNGGTSSSQTTSEEARPSSASASTSGTGTTTSSSSPNPSSSASSATSASSSTVKQFFFCNYPFLMSAEVKRRILLGESAMHQQAATNQALAHGLLSGSQMIFPYFIIPVDRSYLLQSALMHIANAEPLELKKPLKVVFLGEEGVDEGGVRKEFFQLLTTQLFDLNYGMFTYCNHERSLWLNMQNTWSAEEYRLVGSLLALALYNGVLLDVHLPLVFYKKLLQKSTQLEDLQSVDPELYEGLQHLLRFEPAEQVEQVFCRSFVAEWEEFGARRTHCLIPQGDEIAVTGANRAEYVQKYVHWLLEESISEQFQALYSGFTKVIKPGQLLLLTPPELELLMVGTPHLDFRELQEHTEYVGDSTWNASHETVQWFWEVIHELSLEEKHKFLLFVTGSYKAPIGGLKKLGLKIQRMGPDSENLPTAHTCFNILLLPAYSSKEKLRDRLVKAIHECEGFGLK